MDPRQGRKLFTDWPVVDWLNNDLISLLPKTGDIYMFKTFIVDIFCLIEVMVASRECYDCNLDRKSSIHIPGGD